MFENEIVVSSSPSNSFTSFSTENEEENEEEINNSIISILTLKYNSNFIINNLTLQNLTSINLSYFKLKEIPNDLFLCKNLIDLNLSFNFIKNINLLNNKLIKLNLSNNKIEDLNILRELGNLKYLEELNILNNPIINDINRIKLIKKLLHFYLFKDISINNSLINNISINSNINDIIKFIKFTKNILQNNLKSQEKKVNDLKIFIKKYKYLQKEIIPFNLNPYFENLKLIQQFLLNYFSKNISKNNNFKNCKNNFKLIAPLPRDFKTPFPNLKILNLFEITLDEYLLSVNVELLESIIKKDCKVLQKTVQKSVKDYNEDFYNENDIFGNESNNNVTNNSSNNISKNSKIKNNELLNTKEEEEKRISFSEIIKFNFIQTRKDIDSIFGITRKKIDFRPFKEQLNDLNPEQMELTLKRIELKDNIYKWKNIVQSKHLLIENRKKELNEDNYIIDDEISKYCKELEEKKKRKYLQQNNSINGNHIKNSSSMNVNNNLLKSMEKLNSEEIKVLRKKYAMEGKTCIVNGQSFTFSNLFV
ncbi:hypothetical protein ABK040_001406 [Willaertia magna]